VSGLEQLSLVWQAVGRAVTGWTELAELKEGGQRSFQCLIQFLRLNNVFNKKCQWGASALASGQIWIRGSGYRFYLDQILEEFFFVVKFMLQFNA